MELRYSRAELDFRDEVRAFLKDELPADIRAKVARGEHLGKEDNLRWIRLLHTRGWSAPSWPAEHGGPGWSLTQRYIFNEECAAADAPAIIPFGVNMVGPVVYTFGTQAQKDRYLPRILSGEDYWCQGYSEPGSGSDLASLRTRAVRDGDHYVVNGHKTWTSVGHQANMMFCLVRTDGSGKKQEGITFLLIDMATPGITVRPIITIDEGHGVNDTFLDNVRVPVANRVGEENKGWTYAKFLLTNERVGQAEIAHSKRLLARLKATLASTPDGRGATLDKDPSFSQRVVDIEIELTALEYLNLRALANAVAGRDNGYMASLLKIKGTELHQALTELSVDALGYGALPFERLSAAQMDEASFPEPTFDMRNFLYGRAKSIWGGSTEIQKNIVSKQIGL